jgi:pseudouridine synthase
MISGMVTVNGITVTNPGAKADPGRDRITVNNNPLPPPQPYRYILLNKPPGVLSTASDPFGRKHVIGLIAENHVRLYPVGRLDKDTTGALLLTNDGSLAYRLTHPRFKAEKIYQAHVKGRPKKYDLDRLIKGITLDEGPARCDRVCIKKKGISKTVVELVLHEGKKRQIRRMLEKIGYPVVKLHRIAIGGIRLAKLAQGEWRDLTDTEVGKLREECWFKKNSTMG